MTAGTPEAFQFLDTLAWALLANGQDAAAKEDIPLMSIDDVAVRIEGKLARDTLSRGQQKLVAVAMTLAQIDLVRVATGSVPTLLLDDPAAELDAMRLAAFIERVERLGCQLIVTALTPEAGVFNPPDRVFHVEHGVVTQH